MQNRIEGAGNLKPGMQVAIIEDVVTTASSTFTAIDAALHAGLEITHVICLVDREEGGRENLAARGFELDAVFTKTSLLRGVRGGRGFASKSGRFNRGRVVLEFLPRIGLSPQPRSA